MLHWRLIPLLASILRDVVGEQHRLRFGRSLIRRAMAQSRTILAIGLILCTGGCGVSYKPLPAGALAGRVELYDYSPTAIQIGDVEQIWWCGAGVNPTDTTQFSDTIQYSSINLSNHVRYGPIPVLAETQGAWDSVFVCNPKVIMGSFANPLGNGETYTYAMYYVALGATANNFIGVAFSKDGLSWKKYPHPVISPETSDGYGVGQPSVYNTDQHGAIRMFYEDTSFGEHHVEAVSSDGVHFSIVGTLTIHGLDPDYETWGDMAYEPQSGYWYGLFNSPFRDPSTTGGVTERGQYGVKLFRIPDASLLTGATPWELLTPVDTNLTGYESNFIPGFLRDKYGNLVSPQGIQMLMSISVPAPPWNASPVEAGSSGNIGTWKIAPFTWTPGKPSLAFQRYFNQTSHEVTTGWVDPHGNFSMQMTLGHLYQSPQQGATVPFYGCKSGSTDYFVSLNRDCEGTRILGINGYGYSAPVAGLNLVPMYRCSTGHDHFVSADPQCEGQSTQQLLGYVLP